MQFPDFKIIEALVAELRTDPKLFFESESNQKESIILEYKSSFGLDAALSLCPYVHANTALRHNDALVMKILESIIAFANTDGGVLILGVSDAHNKIVNEREREKCKHLHGSEDNPCEIGLDTMPGYQIKNLRIVGIQHELDWRKMTFDAFQRMILDRFSLGSGSNKSQCIKFKPVSYPCDQDRDRKSSGVKYFPDRSPASLIKDILSIDQKLSDSSYLLCAIVVEPSSEPVMVTVREGDSRNDKNIYFARRPGQTYPIINIDNFWQYCPKRFRGLNSEELLSRFQFSIERSIGGIIEDKVEASVSRRLPAAPIWHAVVLEGSAVVLDSGIASTLSDLNGCSTSWFSGDMTVILGAGDVENPSTERIQASWEVHMNAGSLGCFQRGYLLIGCQRLFGGLHSSRYGAQVEIRLNGRPIDGFSLMVIPNNHTDYFHSIPKDHYPSFPIEPFEGCPILYAWSIRKDQLNADGAQTITVRLDHDVAWDVDYVGIVWKA